jgi:signal transduction histidine kinase
VEQARPLAQERALALEADGLSGFSVHGNPDLLIRLFWNLLDNALRYTPAGGRVAVRAERAEGGLRVAIADTGPGITAEHLPHLFERFYRVEAGRDGQGGAGLGLAIALEIARWHGGALWAESTPGRGATFLVRLPEAAAPPR